MRQFLTLFNGAAALVMAAIGAVLLFTLLGGLLMVGGLIVAGLMVAGGLYALFTGRRFFKVYKSSFEDIRIYRPEGTDPFARDMIDVTPPKDRKGR